MRQPRFIQLHEVVLARLADEARAGLAARPARVSPKFLYDALGSRLFDAITELAEYYPTRTEAAIFAAHRQAIAQAVRERAGANFSLVDLGAGNCAKAATWFDALAPQAYVAVDISVDFLRDAVQCLQRQYPAMDMLGLGLDFSERLALPPDAGPGPRVVFYPGSSIGNFAPDAALALLRQAREAAAGGALLIGVDLVKSAEVLEPAYDDALGVTAAFNLNLLNHLNRLLGADFDLRGWRHVAHYAADRGCIEMHLEARAACTVRWPGGERRFAAGERIHTEDSFKWQPDDFAALLRDAGFTRVQAWFDERRWFGVYCAAAG
jgi:L-histidine Nalpha-methyltransferase